MAQIEGKAYLQTDYGLVRIEDVTPDLSCCSVISIDALEIGEKLGEVVTLHSILLLISNSHLREVSE